MLSVFQAARKIPSGTVTTYGELANLIGKPNAARAVGRALGKNPIPLLVPCHRVIASSGNLGGFSGPGGLATKVALLECEGVYLAKPHVLTTPAQWRRAVSALQKQDEAFSRLVSRLEPLAVSASAKQGTIDGAYLGDCKSTTFEQGRSYDSESRKRPDFGKWMSQPAETLEYAGCGSAQSRSLFHEGVVFERPGRKIPGGKAFPSGKTKAHVRRTDHKRIHPNQRSGAMDGRNVS